MKPLPLSAFSAIVMMSAGSIGDYYNEMAALDHATLRRLWINEGKRRGYVLEDA